MMLLYEIAQDGTVKNLPNDPDHQNEIKEATRQAKEFYDKNGFKKPWVAFLAFEKAIYQGWCRFITTPASQKVYGEYFPLPVKESQAIAADLIRKLMEITFFHLRGTPPSSLVIRTPADDVEAVKLFKFLEFKKEEAVDPAGKKAIEWSIDWMMPRR